MIFDTKQVILPILIAFVIVLAIGPKLIPYLRSLKIGNTEREELASHQKKNGTPSMGGLMMLVAIIVVSLIWAPKNHQVLPILFVTVAFGAIGFIDDYRKAILRRSDGLSAKQKFGLEAIVVLVFFIYMKVSGTSMAMLIPFTGGKYLHIGWLAIPVLFLAILGTVNAVNFTDGVDGLASTVTLPVAAFFMVSAMMMEVKMVPICAAVIGALLGFLVFNVYPAKIFMGDTGSLALGGFVSAAAYMLQMPIFILIVGLIYWLELISVIIQVIYFRRTGGKRIFRMTPIHHHFELGGWSETKVVGIFSIVTLLLSFIAMIHLM